VRLRFTQSAEADLEAIADWIAKDNPQRAHSFVYELRQSCYIIADAPEAWPLVERYRAQGVRRKLHGNYLIFYVWDESFTTVIHILHGARDYEDLLE
jgi:toxin ParE1/3/4